MALAGGFSLWRWFQLRSAGFPMAMALRFSESPLAALADRVIAARTDGSSLANAELLRAWSEAEGARWAVVRAIAADPRFRDAIAWQAPHVVRCALDPLLAVPAPTHKRDRSRSRTVVSYLQRYTAKNDTVGFFGPVAWGRFVAGPALEAAHGPAIHRDLRARFEPWAIEVAARSIERDPRVRRHFAARLSGAVWDDGQALRMPSGERRLLGPPERALVDGQGEPTGALAARLVSGGLFASEEEVMTTLARWQAEGVITWGFQCEVAARPEARLLSQIEALPESAGRHEHLGRVSALVARKDALADARGSALLDQLAELDRSFVELTGAPPTRSPGEMYAGRTLVYADALRDIEIRIGEQVARHLAGPLGILLPMARWFTFEVARRYRRALEDIARALQAAEGEVRLPRLWQAASPLFDSLHPAPATEVRALLQATWAETVGPLVGRTLHLDSTRLAAAVARHFSAPHAGWPTARHHCPDVLICSPGSAALQRGELQLVLGELHVGLNVLNTLSAVGSHPDVASLEALYAEDIDGPGIAPVPDEPWARCSHDSRLAPADLHIEGLGPWASWRAAGQVLRAADVVVEAPAHGPVRLRAPAQGLELDLVSVFERPIKVRAVFNFDLFPERPHLPRVHIDDVVVQRERWCLTAADTSFASCKTPPERFLAVRRTAQRLGWPRFVFAKVPTEVKPVYVDLDAPALVELLCKLTRAAGAVTVTEMLPDPTQLWLEDRDGQRYCSEMRLVAVDPVAYPRPAFQPEGWP